MFIALVIKEWREKALIFLFELAVLAGLLATQFLVRQNKDLREWFVYAVLLLFFPFAALILGTAGFESEYRQGAWTFLFSRPVSRATIWWAKFTALLALVAVLWLVFVTAWAAVPPIREMAAGPRVFLDELAAYGFPWWSLGMSLFMFIVAFSLSFLYERYFNLLFVSLVLGLAFPAAAWSVYIVRAGRFLAWIASETAFRTLFIGLILIAAAFVAASVLTLVRADFAQPRKRVWSYARWFVLLLLAGQALTVATALWIPVPGETFLSYMASTDTSVFYQTERGLFAYDISSGKIRWLEKSRRHYYYLNSTSNVRFAYVSFDYVARDNYRVEIWVCAPDGTGRTRILGRDTPGPWPEDPDVRNLVISPDGGRLAVLTAEYRRLPKNRYRDIYALWAVNADGSGLEKLPLDALFMEDGAESVDLSLMAWGRETNVLVISKSYRYPDRPIFKSLWLYDLDQRTLTKVQDDAMQASWRAPVSPRGDLFAIRYPYADVEAPRTLALLDLKTRERIDIVKSPISAMLGLKWDPTGERIAYTVERPEPGGQSSFVLSVYSLTERRQVAEKVIARSKREFLYYGVTWMPDGRSLVVFDREGRNLLFLGLDLQETGRLALPEWLKEPWENLAVNRQLLITDPPKDSLWRLDLDTKRWTRLY